VVAVRVRIEHHAELQIVLCGVVEHDLGIGAVDHGGLARFGAHENEAQVVFGRGHEMDLEMAAMRAIGGRGNAHDMLHGPEHTGRR